jgi:uncharacterized RDD family membrane protein YckC
MSQPLSSSPRGPAVEPFTGRVRTLPVVPGRPHDGPVVAGTGRRAVAFFVDAVLGYLVLLGGMALGTVIQGGPATGSLIPGIGFGVFAIYLLVLIVCVAYWGTSLGNSLLGLRVLRVDSLDPAGFYNSFARGLVLLPFVFWPWGLALLFSVRSDPTGRGRGWHDRAGNTAVLDIRAGIDPLHETGPFAASVRLSASPDPSAYGDRSAR